MKLSHSSKGIALAVAIGLSSLLFGQTQIPQCGDKKDNRGWSTACDTYVQARDPSPCAYPKNATLCDPFCDQHYPKATCATPYLWAEYTGAAVNDLFSNGSDNSRECGVDCYRTQTCTAGLVLLKRCAALNLICIGNPDNNCAVCDKTTGGAWTKIASHESSSCGG
jgi:hypothetical protein